MSEPHPMFEPDLKEILESFLIETKEILDKLDQDLMKMEKDPNDMELLNTVFRSFHTIKGTSGFLGFDQMMEITHNCEDVLNKLRKSELHLNGPMMDVIFEAYDIMKALIASVESGVVETMPMEETIAKLVLIGEGKVSADTVLVAAETVTAVPEKSVEAHVEKQVEHRAEEHEESIVEIPMKDVLHPVQEQTKAAAPKEKVADKSVDNTIRVDVIRLDNLMNLVGELVLGRNRLAQLSLQNAQENEGAVLAKEMLETSSQIDFITTELQTAIMKTRMVPIGKVFNKFPRLVRDLAKETEKEIDLVIVGEETELDKSIIDEINDPLVHLIRNSCDHGVERPDVRTQKGKNPRGQVLLKAEYEGNTIVVSIKDDGNGMDAEKLKAKAIEKGMITAAEAKEMTKRDALNLIFAPGFSTAAKVTNVSGRGVGMDVVKTNIQKLKGIIEIESELGVGSTITIKLPLTLAIIQGLLVTAKENTFAIPLSSVLEVVRVKRTEISTVHGHEVIRLRDRVLPLARIDELLQVGNAKSEVRDWEYVVVIGLAEKSLGLVVDSLLGQKEVVIKSLGEYFHNSRGIAGSTILGDGRVIMVVDENELFNLAHA